LEPCSIDLPTEMRSESQALCCYLRKSVGAHECEEAAFAQLVLLRQERRELAKSIAVRHVVVTRHGQLGARLNNDLTVTGFSDNSPAAAAGMVKGDQLLSITVPAHSWSHACGSKPRKGKHNVLLKVVRSGKLVNVLATSDEEGMLGLTSDDEKFPELGLLAGHDGIKESGLQSGDRLLSMTVPVITRDQFNMAVQPLTQGSCIVVACLSDGQRARNDATAVDMHSASCLSDDVGFVRIPPCDIRFTQSTIKDAFQDGRSLSDVAGKLAHRDIEKREITMIKIVKHTDGHFYSLDNRRLAVFRLLQLSGKTRRIKAEVIIKPPAEWRRKFDTQCNGMSVRVRGPHRYTVGHTKETTSFPFPGAKASRNDDALFKRVGGAHIAMACVAVLAETTVTEATVAEILEGMDSDIED